MEVAEVANANVENLIYHTNEYQQFIEEAFGCNYKFFRSDDGKTVLPLVEVKSKIFGNKIISTAYLEYGGFFGECCKNNVSEILDKISKEYKENNNYLEIRGATEEIDGVLSNYPEVIKKNLYKRFVLHLDGGEEEVWRGIQKWKKKAVRKALKSVDVKEIPFSDLEEFYSLYCQNMRQFGSPPYSQKYFQSFYKHLVSNGLGKIYGAYHKDNGKLIAALLGFCYGNRTHILIAVSDDKSQQFRPNDATHWTFIKWACQNSYKVFDFGRVREESGQFEFKRKWGAELKELPSYFILWKGKNIPLVDPSSKQYQLMLKLWKQTPLVFTKLIGPKLRKGLGI